MGAPKRLPSFSQRPGFPSGLRVLLVDSDVAARTRTEQQLRECDYMVTSCSSCAEAVVHLSSAPASFDVLLADKAAVAGAAAEPEKAAAAGEDGAAATVPLRSGLLDSCKELPCILMAADPTPRDVLQGISLGAVDFLAKPLSQLKLRNIWQHTVRKMMSDMQICPGKAAAKAPRRPQVAPAAVLSAGALDRSASNLPSMLPTISEQLQQQEEQPAPSAPKQAAAGSSLPPRSPGVRGPLLRAQRTRLHACISSSNLAAGPATVDDDCDFDFEAADAAAATPAAPAASEGGAADDGPSSPECSQGRTACPGSSSAAPTASGATATATATHVSVPAPSCGVPVPGALAPLSVGMVWGLPMPAVRAPGIVPPKEAAPQPPQPHPAAAWGYMGYPGYSMPPPYMMLPPPPAAMCGAACPPGYGPYGYAMAHHQQQQHQQQYHHHQLQQHQQQHQQQQQRQQATCAAAAQALDASLMSLLGSAEDDDLDLDLEDVLQDLSGPAQGSGRAAGGKGPAAAFVPAAGTPCSLGSSQDGLCGSDDGGLLRSASDDDEDAFLGAVVGGGCGAQLCSGGFGMDDPWSDHLPLKKSASLADLLGGPLMVA